MCRGAEGLAPVVPVPGGTGAAPLEGPLGSGASTMRPPILAFGPDRPGQGPGGRPLRVQGRKRAVWPDPGPPNGGA